MAALSTLLLVLLIGILGNPIAAVSRANLTTLRQVQIIYRHGARNIDESYPLDPYRNESFWLPGYSQLTNEGKLQGYQLGKELRQRYSGFIGDTYNLKDIYVLSSDLTRTMQTAEAVLAGFYLPNGMTREVNLTDMAVVNNEVEVPLPWKSVPIHTIPVEYDNLLRQRSQNCPKWMELFSQEDSKQADLTPDRKEFYDFINENTGLNISDAFAYNKFLDTIVQERNRNFTMPNWTERVFAEQNDITGFFPMLTATYEMKRLRAGPLLGKLRENILLNNSAIQNEYDRARSGKKKIYFFSGHDISVACILTTLGMFNMKRPPFTAALLLELHEENNSGEYYVEIYYRNETDKDSYKLDIPSCGEGPCMLTNFLELINPYIPSAWGEECKPTQSSGGMSAVWIAIIIVVVWIAMFIALQCWIRSGRKNCFGKRTRRNSYDLLK